jgi:NAD(P)H-flavin reductase
MPVDSAARHTEPAHAQPVDGLCAMVVTGVTRVADGPMVIRCARPETLRFQPAQVAELGVNPGDLNYYAIASAPAEPGISFVIKPSMPPAAIDAVRPGDTVWMRGPWGKGFHIDNAPQLLLCGIGSAVGALRSALVAALDAGIEPACVTLLLGLRRLGDLPIASDVTTWTARGVRVELALSAPEPGDLAAAASLGAHAATGRITDVIPSVATPHSTVLLAASDEAEQTLIARLTDLGVPYAAIQRNYRVDWRDGRGTQEI